MTSLPKIDMQDLEKELEQEFGGKIVPLTGNQLVKTATPDPASELEKLADVHRDSIARRKQRVANRRRDLAATIASLEAQQRQERERHTVELRRLDEALAEARRAGERDVMADLRIIEASQAALKILQ